MFIPEIQIKIPTTKDPINVLPEQSLDRPLGKNYSGFSWRISCKIPLIRTNFYKKCQENGLCLLNHQWKIGSTDFGIFEFCV